MVKEWSNLRWLVGRCLAQLKRPVKRAIHEPLGTKMQQDVGREGRRA